MRDAFERAQLLDVRLGDEREQPRVGLRHPRERLDLPRPVRADLQHRVPVLGAEPEGHHRRADEVVEVPLRRVDLARVQPREQRLRRDARRRLARGPRDRERPANAAERAPPKEVGPRQRPERLQRAADPHKRSRGDGLLVPLHDEHTRPPLHRFFKVIVRVVRLATERHEERAFAHRARVRRHLRRPVPVAHPTPRDHLAGRRIQDLLQRERRMVPRDRRRHQRPSPRAARRFARAFRASSRSSNATVRAPRIW